MRKHRSFLRSAAALIGMLSLMPDAVRPAVAAEDTDYRYYVAALAAADASLRLHEVPAARQWLQEAPPSHRGWEWSHLAAALDRSAAAFTAHDGQVNDLALSPDGKVLASCGGNEVGLWDVATGERLGTLAGHTRPVWNARFSPDGSRLATVASDSTLRLWDVVTGRETARVSGIGHGVAGVAWHPAGLRLATSSWLRDGQRGVVGIVDEWDAATGMRRHHLEHGVKPIGAVNYAPDGNSLWAGTWDYDVAGWDAATWESRFQTFPPQDDAYKRVNECRPSPDGSRLAAAHDDGAVRILDSATGTLLRTLQRQAEGARLPQNDAVWLPDGRRLATVSKDLTLRLWDAVTGEHLSAWHGHDRAVTALAASPDGRTLFSGDEGGVVRRWNLADLTAAGHEWALPGTGYCVVLSHAGSRAATTGWGGWIAEHDLASGALLRQWEGHEVSGVRAAWAPGDTLLATAGNDGRVRLWDLRPDPPRLVREHTVGVQSTAVGFSADGRWLAALGGPAGVIVWSVTDGTEVAMLTDGTAFSDAVWHPQRPLLAACGQDGAVRVWEPATGAILAKLTGHGAAQLRAAFSPDGRRLALASGSGTVRVWDTGGWGVVQEMLVPNGGQQAVAFAPDGRRLATAGSDNFVHIWDPDTGAHLLRLPFPASPYDLAWSANGRSLLVLPLDGTVRLLD